MDKNGYKPNADKYVRPGMDDDDFEISQFVGDVVVFKYGSVKWYLAKVEEAGSEAIAQGWNCTLNWWLDAAPSKTLAKLCASTQVVHFKPGDARVRVTNRVRGSLSN